VDRQTDALNLWDIEIRITKLHGELEILHQLKEELLRKQDLGVKDHFLEN